jgi:hypothetical protein
MPTAPTFVRCSGGEGSPPRATVLSVQPTLSPHGTAQSAQGNR